MSMHGPRKGRGPGLASRYDMGAVLHFGLFALERVRIAILALALIVLVKTAWVILALFLGS
jgi:hypothetical protein